MAKASLLQSKKYLKDIIEKIGELDTVNVDSTHEDITGDSQHGTRITIYWNDKVEEE